MGAHTLGKADIHNSGFHGEYSPLIGWHKTILIFDWLPGTWVNNEQGYFSNQYYTNMVNQSLDWRLVTKTCESLPNVDADQCSGEVTGWEWNVGFTGFNLNADMSLYKYFSVDDEGKPSCDYSSCPLSPSARLYHHLIWNVIYDILDMPSPSARATVSGFKSSVMSTSRCWRMVITSWRKSNNFRDILCNHNQRSFQSQSQNPYLIYIKIVINLRI